MVASGGEYISDKAKTAMVLRFTGRKSPGEQTPLTRREHEVLKLIAAGKTTNQIADALFISSNTAETHRRNLLHKLHLPNAASLVRYAVEHGLAEE
jgi:DNA-binding NarL/FixJ family response regulator